MKSKFIKVLGLIVSVSVLVTALAGCGSASKPNESKGTGAEATAVNGETGEKVKMQFWMRAATKNSVTGKLVEMYNKENKDNVEIEFEVYGENYKDVVMMALTAGNPPDIFELNGGLTISQLAEGDLILPLDQYADESFKSGIYPEVFKQKQFYYNDKLYAIPERSAFFRLMYNKDIFAKVGIAEPPKTLEEMMEIAKKITAAGNGEFYGYGAALKTTSSFGRFTDNISSISGITGEAAFDWTTGKFDFTKQKKALQLLIDMGKENVLYPGALNLDIEVARVQFAQGKIGMMIDGNWMVGVFGNNEVQCDIDWDSAPVPVFAGDKTGKSYMYFDMSKLIAKGTKYPEKAWNFIKFLLENQSEFVKNGEPLRTSIKANATENIPMDYKGNKGFTDIENSKAFPLQVQNFLTKLEGDKYEKVYQTIFAGALDIDKGLADLNERYNAALEKAIADGSISEADIKIPGFDYFDYYSK